MRPSLEDEPPVNTLRQWNDTAHKGQPGRSRKTDWESAAVLHGKAICALETPPGRCEASFMIARHEPIRSVSLLRMMSAVDGQQQPSMRLDSRVIDWTTLKPAATPTGQRRDVFDAPTATLDK